MTFYHGEVMNNSLVYFLYVRDEIDKSGTKFSSLLNSAAKKVLLILRMNPAKITEDLKRRVKFLCTNVFLYLKEDSSEWKEIKVTAEKQLNHLGKILEKWYENENIAQRIKMKSRKDEMITRQDHILACGEMPENYPSFCDIFGFLCECKKRILDLCV